MRIVWDEPKRLVTLEKRGLDFADLTLDFFAEATVLQAKQGHLMAIGHLRDQVLAVVFRPMGREALSVISMRPANRKERDLL